MKILWKRNWCWWLLMLAGLLVAWWLRLYHLGSLPAGATVDEVSYGYIAYSLAKTGKDEHGVSWPLVFQAYGDQKLRGQMYLIFVLVKLFGLSLTTTRLPSALASCGLIVLIYWLVRTWRLPRWCALATAGLWAMAAAPFLLGRGAWESNLAMAGWTLGLSCWAWLVNNRQKQKWQDCLATLGWALGWTMAWYSYIAYRPIIAASLLWLAFIFWQTKALDKQQKKYFVGACATMLILISPLLMRTQSTTNTTRLFQLSGDTMTGITLEVNEKRTFCERQGNLPRLWCDAIFNKATALGRLWLKDVVAVFGGEYLVWGKSENSWPAVEVDGIGDLPLLVYLLALLSLVPLGQALTNKNDSRQKLLAQTIPVLILIGIVPAVIVDGYQKVRLSAMYPLLFLLVAVELDYLGQKWQKWQQLHRQQSWLQRNWPLLIMLIAGGYTIFEWCYFLTSFFGYHYFKNDWQTLAYVKDINRIVNEQQPDYVYWHANYPDVLTFYAFDTQLEPTIFQQETEYFERESSGFQHVASLQRRFFQTDQSLTDLVCGQQATDSGKVLIVEQDGALITQINDLITKILKTDDEQMEESKPILAWPIKTANEAMTLGYIVDAQWYDKVWCQKHATDK